MRKSVFQVSLVSLQLQVLEIFSSTEGLVLRSNSAGCVSNIALLSTELTSLKSILMKSPNSKLSFLVLGFSTVARISKFCPKILVKYHSIHYQSFFRSSYLVQSNLVIRNCLIRNKLVLRNHFLQPIANLLHKSGPPECMRT